MLLPALLLNLSFDRRYFFLTPLVALTLLLSTFASNAQSVNDEIAPEIKFTVSAFEVTGASPLDSLTTDQVLDPFRGDFDGLDGLLAAADALQRALNEQGYTFYKVVLPPQTLEGGVVILDVVPLAFGEISLEGNEHFSAENILRSLPSVASGTTPDTAAIAQNLETLNRHPSKKTNVRLRQSKQAAAVDAIVSVKDKRPYQFFAGLNNIGTRQTGRSRLSLGGQYNNLFDLDHKLTLSYTTSPENISDVTQVSANYELPMYRANGFLSAFYSFSDVNIGQVGDFEVSGAGRFWGLSYTQILRKHGKYRHQWSLGLQNRFFENNVDFLGLLPIGVDVRSFPITLSYQGTYVNEQWAGSYSAAYSRNLAIKDRNDDMSYRLSRAGAQSNWDALRINGNLSYKLPHNWLIRSTLDAQYAGEALIPGEQFGLGGWRSIRGLDERSVTGDNGLRTSFEAWTPNLPQVFGLRFLMFVDIGFRDREDPQAGEVDTDTLSSVGIGARWQWKNQLNASLDYGHTIAEGEGPTAAAKDEAGVKWHFNLYYRF